MDRKNQGQNHRPTARSPKRLTFRSGSDFFKVKRKRPSVKVKRLVSPWATAAPRFGHASPPYPVKFWHSRVVQYRRACTSSSRYSAKNGTGRIYHSSPLIKPLLPGHSNNVTLKVLEPSLTSMTASPYVMTS